MIAPFMAPTAGSVNAMVRPPSGAVKPPLTVTGVGELAEKPNWPDGSPGSRTRLPLASR